VVTIESNSIVEIKITTVLFLENFTFFFFSYNFI
jgi:hypothetical protein